MRTFTVFAASYDALGAAEPDMNRAGRPGRSSPTRAATSLPSISGMTTSVGSRSMGWSWSPASY